MKTLKKAMILIGILMMCLALAACTSRKKEPQSAENTEKQTDRIDEEAQEPVGSDPMSLPPYTFDIETKNWTGEGITLKYPEIIHSNMQEETDEVNDLIVKDLSEVIESIKNTVNDTTLTIDGAYEYERYAPDVLSIKYMGSYASSLSAYPVNFYHTITLSLEQAAVIPLSDLFVIDEAFVEGLKNWMYAPYSESLDLEESSKSIDSLLSEQYSNDTLVQWLCQEKAPYYLTSQGLILSFEVPHALGDHLELAMNYEFLEQSIKRDHPAWKNYLFLSEEAKP